MRFIYLSKTDEALFETKDSTNNFFKEFITGTRKTFNIKVDGTKKPIEWFVKRHNKLPTKRHIN